MGIFVLGILVGWLAEWLFFTFWVKNNSKSDSSDCSKLSAQLRVKNSEIESLKASLSKAENSKVASKAESAVSVASTTAPSIEEKVKKAPATKKATTEKAKVPAKKSTPKKTIAKDPAKKVTKTKKSAPVAKKADSAKKKVSTKKILGDDLTKLSGIGPSMAATMAELGITSYKKLAAMDDDILRDMLEASGARLNNNKDAMDSWNEQATLADKGDFEGLKKLQEEIKK